MPDAEQLTPHRAGGEADLEARSRRIVDDTVKELKAARLSKPTRMLVEAALRLLTRRGGYDDVITEVERLVGETGKVTAVLERCASSLREEEEREAARQPGSDIWWNTRKRAIIRAWTLGAVDQGTGQWCDLWVEALAGCDWARCGEVLGLDRLPREAVGLRATLAGLTDAVRGERYADALDPLDDLLDPRGRRGWQLDEGAEVRLAVLRTRILMSEFSDRDVVREAAAGAYSRAKDDRWRSLALAVRAEAQLAQHELEEARETLKLATATDPPPTDTLVAAGRLLEQDGMWAMADQYYDLAVAADPDAVLPCLARPVPARLLVRAAVSSRLGLENAVDLLRRALDGPVPGEGDYPDREVHLAYAEKLLELAERRETSGDRPAAAGLRRQAALSLVEAGNRFAWAGQTPQGIELLERACSLAPEEAACQWALGEALRLAADDPDGIPDRATLERAREHNQRGLGLQSPGPDEAWVLVCRALIEEVLADSDDDPAVLAERALLLNPLYTLGHGFLAGIIRRQGYPGEALQAAAERRSLVDSSDPTLVEIHLGLLIDHARLDQALALLDEQEARRPSDELPVVRAHVLLLQRRFDDALDCLEGVRLTEGARMLRGHCLYAAGMPDAARDEFWSLWTDARGGQATGIAGWAAFRCGLVEQGISIYRDLQRRANPTLPYTRDLGQMLLVAGELDEGRTLLERGIATCPYVEDLRQLAGIELGYVRGATAGQAHGAAVHGIVDELELQIEARCADLLAARRPEDDLAARLARAREAVSRDEHDEALRLYAELVARDRLAETVPAAERAGRAALRGADERYRDGGRSSAVAVWTDIDQALERVDDTPGNELHVSLTCRRAVAGLVDPRLAEPGAELSLVAGEPELPAALAGAARALGGEAQDLWSIRDGLTALSASDRLRDDVRQAAGEVAKGLSFSAAYGLAADAADLHGLTFLLVTPLELRLGPGLEDLADCEPLQLATAELQDRIEQELGVRVPWVRPVPWPQLAERRIQLRVFGRGVGGAELPEEPGRRLADLTHELDELLRSHLFRMISVDDVGLWMEWDPDGGPPHAWDPADPLADRLRLARVLRLLLRERVSVRNRGVIVDTVRGSPGPDRRHVAGTLDTLRAVRRRLGPAALGVAEDTLVVDLPPGLEERLSRGLAPKRPVWDLPRDQAIRLLGDLRAWLDGCDTRPGAIRVRDPRLRPFVWRLLAAERPAIRVVSEEECP